MSERKAGPPTDYDVLHYDISIAVDMDTEIIAGDVEITLITLVDDFATVFIDLQEAMVVSAISRDGNSLAFTHTSDRLDITLDQPFANGEQLTIRVQYAGHPIEGGLLSFSFDTHDGTPIASTLSEPWFARNWWPCKETSTDKATADISFTVPSDMTAASNGLLVEVVDNGDTKTFHWVESYPIATYLISAAITNYVTFSEEYITAAGDTVPVDYYVYPEDFAWAQDGFSVTVPQMEYFRTIYGEYPFEDEKYGMAEFPWGGAMEHQTMTSIGECCLDHSSMIAHETAHQWWGDLVTCGTWHDIWLNEGFAVYSEALWYAETHPPDGLQQFMGWINDTGGFPGAVYRYNLDDPWDIFSYVVYYKGGWVLHMLRGVVGDAVFFDALADYRDAFEHSSAITEDLEEVFEAASGMTLDWFFDQWVYGENRPSYEYGWEAGPEPATLTLQIEQVQQNAPPFKMPIVIEVETLSGSERFTVWDSLATTQVFVLPLSDEPTNVIFDPDDWILDWHSEVVLGVDDPAGAADVARIVLSEARPQPFTSSVGLAFTVPGEEGQFQHVDLAVYDVMGRRVKSLVVAAVSPGEHEVRWDGRTNAGVPVSPGVYFARLVSDTQSDVQRIVMVR